MKRDKEVQLGQIVEPEHESNIFRSEPSPRKQSKSVQNDGDKKKYKEEDKFSDPFSFAGKATPGIFVFR